jgi:hypothetical protein
MLVCSGLVFVLFFIIGMAIGAIRRIDSADH